MVGTELVLAFHFIGGALPTAFIHVVGHLNVAGPVVEAADDTDACNRNDVPCHLIEVDIHLIETSGLGIVGEALAGIVTILLTIDNKCTVGSCGILTPVAIPIVLVGLELEATVEPVEALVDTVLGRTAELVSCRPAALVTNLIDVQRPCGSWLYIAWNNDDVHSV